MWSLVTFYVRQGACSFIYSILIKVDVEKLFLSKVKVSQSKRYESLETNEGSLLVFKIRKLKKPNYSYMEYWTSDLFFKASEIFQYRFETFFNWLVKNTLACIPYITLNCRCIGINNQKNVHMDSNYHYQLPHSKQEPKQHSHTKSHYNQLITRFSALLIWLKQMAEKVTEYLKNSLFCFSACRLFNTSCKVRKTRIPAGCYGVNSRFSVTAAPTTVFSAAKQTAEALINSTGWIVFKNTCR